MRKCLKTHFINPRFEVESFDRRHSIVALTLSQNVVVLARRVETEEHCLSAEDGCVIPRRLNEDLSDVVQFG
jgi:hypothetical protein